MHPALFILLVAIMIMLAFTVPGGEPFHAGLLDDDISRGNPLSWSGYDNPRYPTVPSPEVDLTRFPKISMLQIITPDQSFPLSYGRQCSPPSDGSMFHVNRRRSPPDCCPSSCATKVDCVCK